MHDDQFFRNYFRTCIRSSAAPASMVELAYTRKLEMPRAANRGESMRITIVLAAVVLVQTAAAQTPVAALATPASYAQHFTVMSTAGKHGESTRWTTPEGVRLGRESIVLRGQVFELDSASHVGADGRLARAPVRGV